MRKAKGVWNKTAKIRSALRQVWRWSPLVQQAKLKARIGRGSYLCALCNKVYGPKEIQVDHIEPVTPFNWNSKDWTIYVERLFSERLQILCKPCHAIKTKQERSDYRRRAKGAV